MIVVVHARKLARVPSARNVIRKNALNALKDIGACALCSLLIEYFATSGARTVVSSTPYGKSRSFIFLLVPWRRSTCRAAEMRLRLSNVRA